MTPIVPMLARATTGASNRTPVDLRTLVGYTFDLKLDGLRAIAYWDGAVLRLLNRSLKDITAQFPEIEASAPVLGPAPLILDGEVVADTGLFETVATRGKTTRPADVARRATALPCRFVAFDVLAFGDQNVMPFPHTSRRELLATMAGVWEGSRFTEVVSSDDGPLIWAQVAKMGLEGLIAKRATSPYVPGSRTDAWLKFKVTRRITAVAVGYEPGEGSRAAFGAMQLALIGPDGPVRIGTVGTGFKDADLRECKARLDAGAPFLVEIEALNRTKAGLLRFPVYRGIRTDLPITAAALDQLDSLPLC